MAKRQSTKGTATAELVPTEQTDLQVVQEVGAGVIAWLKGAAQFLTTAKKYEDRALQLLADAKKAKLPKDGDQDAKLQETIQAFNKGKATILGHWNGSNENPGPASLLFRLHRRVTARRDVGVKALDEGAGILNKLHNQYVDEERRRAEAETRRLQQEEEQRAREQRERELAELERQALEAEEATEELSEREQRFVTAIAVNYDPTVAAREAGYKDPVKQGARLLTHTKILDAIEARKAANAAREQAAAIAETPVEVRDVEVKPDIKRGGTAKSVTRWKAEVTDAEAFISAVFENKLGIPRDVLTIDEVKLNQYARDLHQLIDRWPGVRAIKDTKVQ